MYNETFVIIGEFDQSINQSIGQSINQSITQSINVNLILYDNTHTQMMYNCYVLNLASQPKNIHV